MIFGLSGWEEFKLNLLIIKLKRSKRWSFSGYTCSHIFYFAYLINAILDSNLRLFMKKKRFSEPWTTKYTAVYVTFEGQKLRGQFSENLCYEFTNFSLILVVKFPKKKNYEISVNEKLKYDRYFQLTNCLFSLILFF